jgi:hypothetical protein
VDWQQVLPAAVLTWLLSRAFLAGVALLAVRFAGAGHGSLLEAWRQWDTGWYLAISRFGYFSVPAANFFPLYPTLVGLVAFVLGDGGGPVELTQDPLRLGVGLLVSNAAALGAFLSLGMLALGEGESRPTAARTMRIAAAYPMALFLGAAYSESLFLALATLTLVFSRRGNWAAAALTGMLAGLTRSAAVVLVAPLAWEYGRQHGWWQREAWRRWRWHGLPAAGEAAMVLAAVPAGFAIYMSFLWYRFGDPLLFVHTQVAYWHHQFLPPWQTLAIALDHLVQRRGGAEGADLLLLAFITGVTAMAARRQPVAFTLYMAGLIYVSIGSPTPALHDVIPSTGRYLVGSAPAFLWLARWTAGRPRLEVLGLGLGLAAQASLLVLFLKGGPVL